MAKLLFIQKKLVEYLSIQALSGFLKQNNHQCQVLCYGAENNFYKKVKDYNPDIIAASLMIGEYCSMKTVFKNIKKKNPSKPIIVGGPFLTSFPEIIKEDFIDITVVGDGEHSLLEILNRIDKNSQNFSNIDGVSFKKNNKVISSKNLAFIKDLTALPIPDRDIYYSKYKALRELKTKPFILSRGCPFSCSYCYSAQYNEYFRKCGTYWRLKDPYQVIREIRQVRNKYGLKWVQFHDGTFNANKIFIKNFLKLYAKSKLPKFLINSRTENIDKEYVYLLKKAGCDRVTIGIQHGNEEFRREIANRPMKNKQIIESGKLLKKYNIRICIDLIFGWPNETLKLAFETVNFSRKLKAEVINANVLRLYPKTAITKYAAKKGLLDHKVTIDEVELLHPNTSQLKQKNIKQLINLAKLHYLAIKYPKLEWLVKLLIRFPPSKLFLFIEEIPFIKRNFKYEIKSNKQRLIYLINYFKSMLNTGEVAK